MKIDLPRKDWRLVVWAIRAMDAWYFDGTEKEQSRVYDIEREIQRRLDEP